MLNKMRLRFVGAAMTAFAAVVVLLLLGVNITNYVYTVRQLDSALEQLCRLENHPEQQPSGEHAPRHAPEGPGGEGAPPQAEADSTSAQSGDAGSQAAVGTAAQGENQPAASVPEEGQPHGPAPGQGSPPPEDGGERGPAPQDAAGSEPEPPDIMPGGRFSDEVQYMNRFFTVRCNTDGSVADVDKEYIASITEEDAEQYAAAVLAKQKDSGWYNGYRWRREDGEEILLVFLNAEKEAASTRTIRLISCVIALLSLAAVLCLVLALSGQAIQPYARTLAVQKQFITDASHELKTPLTAIATSADVLEMEYPDDEWVGSIREQCTRMRKLIADLVTLSRLDEEQPFPEKERFNLSDLVWETAEPFASRARAGGIEYSQTIDDGIEYVGEAASIQRLISILLDNAVRYTPAGGDIRLALHRRGRGITLTVSNPCDLAALGELDRLFDRFYRPDASRSAHSGGTGIGLSIARSVAEAHGGSIRATAEGDDRICFTVTM